MLGYFKFGKIAIANMISVGSIFPSTRFVCRKVTAQLPKRTGVVVEYGPGNGVITKWLLNRIPSDGKLFAVELNPDFIEILKKIPDARLEILHNNAVDVSARLKNLDKRGVDVAVSGIPFSLMPKSVVEEIVKNTQENLNNDGCFIVYQYSRYALPILRKYFRQVDVTYEPRNIFPYFIMTARK